MSLIPFLLISKQFRESEAKKSGSSKGSSVSNSSNYEHSPLTAEEVFSASIKDTTFFNCDVGRIVMNQLLDNEEVLKVIEKVIENFDATSEEISKDIDKEISSFCKPAQEFIDLMHSVEEMGFKIDREKDGKEIWFPLAQDNERGFGYHTLAMDSGLNGIDLTSEQVTNGENPYANRLENFRQENPNIHEDLLKEQTIVDKLSNKKLLLKLSSAKRQELEEAQARLSQIKTLIQTEEKYIADSNLFEGLTTDQKGQLVKYLDQRENFEELGQSVSNLRYDSLLKEGYYDRYNAEQNTKYEKFISEIIEKAKSELTDEEKILLENFCADTTLKICSASEKELEDWSKCGRIDLKASRGTNKFMGYICETIQKMGNLELEKSKDLEKDAH